MTAPLAGAQQQARFQDDSAIGGYTVKAVSSSWRHLSLEVSLPVTGVSDMLLQDSRTGLPPIIPRAGQLEVGKPDLPAFGEWLLVPNGTALSLRINPGEPLVFDGIDVPPMQPPRVDRPTRTIRVFSPRPSRSGMCAVRTAPSSGFIPINTTR
ncbi:MAG: hypothetical protein ACYSW0_20855, partial [Planctomycetota bacterium]|jgi:hypothetical protein